MLDPDAPLSLAYLTYRGKPHVGGQGVYTRHLTKALVELGHSVEVFGGQPYPVLDERVPLHKLPSLDLFNDQYPGRFPAYWEMQDAGRLARGRAVLAGRVPRAAGVQRCGPATSCSSGRRVRPRARQPVPRLRHPASIEQQIPTDRHAAPPDHRDRELEMEPRAELAQAAGRSAAGTRSCRCRAGSPRRCRASSSSARTRIQDIHTDMGVDLDRMRLVPVGVDPELFRPLAEVGARPGPADHHGVAPTSPSRASPTCSRRWPSCAPSATSRSPSSASPSRRQVAST